MNFIAIVHLHTNLCKKYDRLHKQKKSILLIGNLEFSSATTEMRSKDWLSDEIL